MSRGFDEGELAVARVYAEATLELADKAGKASSVFEELEGLRVLLDREPDFERALSSPLVDAETRRSMLEKTLRNRVSDLVANSLQVMNTKGRLGLLRTFVEGYRREFEKRKGVTEVDVTSAGPLTSEQRTRAEQVASKWTGGPVRLVEIVDPDIIGGLIFKAGDRKLNRSVLRELNTMNALLLERASQHVQDLSSVAE